MTFSKVFKNKKYPEILKENVWEFAWDHSREGITCPTNTKIRYIQLNFQFLKLYKCNTFHIKSLSISETYRVLTLGFQLPQEP